MLRQDQYLYPQRKPVTPLQAATLLLLRDRPQGGWEVLMTRRSDKASFVPGAYVFPGGGIEVQDAHAQSQVLHRAGMDAQCLTAAIAALRESWEEMGVLLAVHADGRAATHADVDVLDRSQPLWPQLVHRNLQLDVRNTWQLAHWTADRNLPKRFAVPFFVARMPEGQTPVADESEQFEPVWVNPQEALERHRAGRMPMIFPTLRTLQRLAAYSTVQAVLDAVVVAPLWRSVPRSGCMQGKEWRCMEHDPAYGELAMVCPDGQPLHELAWQSSTAVPLRQNILRLTAPNANVMTGPGTNSYLVGEAASGYIAIDPGPADVEHVARLLDAAGGDVRHIVCTHSHPDHSPGAWLLQDLCVQRGLPKPLIYGLPSAVTAQSDSQFVPDVVWDDGACLVLTANLPEGGLRTHSLRAVHTPGHAANHLCVCLEEDGLLFTGDHILNGSTTLIALPDGNMQDYLDSLDKLAALCTQQHIAFLLPAHGYVLHAATQAIAQLKAHRLKREAHVIAAMQQKPDGSMQDWVALAYADTPKNLWPLAERSLMAHVERIRALGLHHVSD